MRFWSFTCTSLWAMWCRIERFGRLWIMRIWTIQLSTLFSEKNDLSHCCADISVSGRLDRLLIWVNNSIWDKYLFQWDISWVSFLIVFLNNVTDFFFFFLILQPVVLPPCKGPKFHLILEITQLSLYCKKCFILFFQDIFNHSNIEYTKLIY